MKLNPIIITFFLFACAQESKTVVENKSEIQLEVIQETTPLEDSSSQTVSQMNYIDEKGLKQGKWLVKGYKNKIVRIETYRNDTLHGYWLNLNGMQEEGRYINGKRQGFFSTFYGDKSEQSVMLLKFYKNDSVLWFACPAADSRSVIPVKGFKTNEDSIFIEAPHYNKSIWYKGLFIKNKPKGMHLIHDENERLLARTNYTDSTIQFTEYASEGFVRSASRFSPNWRIIQE